MKDIKKQLQAIIKQNDLNLIDRDRTGDIGTININNLTKDLAKFIKELKK